MVLPILKGKKEKKKKIEIQARKKKKKSQRNESSLLIFNLEDIEVVEGIDDDKFSFISQIRLENKFGQSLAFVIWFILSKTSISMMETSSGFNDPSFFPYLL